MSALNREIKDIVGLAVKMETDGIIFYSKAGEQVKSPMGKLMFQSLVKDEKTHLVILNNLLEQMFDQSIDEVLKADPVSRVKTIFDENRAGLEEKIAAEPGDLEAIEMALEMENKGYNLYKEASEKERDEDRQALFARLAEEERKHYQILENTLSYLSDSGNWFIYEDHGIMDGG